MRDSWPRAIAIGVVVVLVGFGAAVVAPNLIVTRATSLSAQNRALIATGMVIVVVAAISWALRRLQARGVI